MFDRIDKVIKPLAKRLQADHMSRIGIRNTMRLAHAYNRVKHGRMNRFRNDQYQNHFDELIRENGERGISSLEMKDGWAIDTSQKLPYLDRLLKEAQSAISEREARPRKKAGEYRPFFQNIAVPEDLQRFPSFLDFATSSEVLGVVARYLKTIPVLSGTLPPGVRLAESFTDPDNPSNGGYRDSQLYHIDYYALPMVYVIVLLRDVTIENGPFCWMPVSTSEKAARALEYWSRDVPYRITDEQFYAVADKKGVHEFSYPKGTVLFIDSSRCFHFGSRDSYQPRYQMMYGYSTACRTDWSEIVGEPIRFPVRETDSRLRKMVLCKEFTN